MKAHQRSSIGNGTIANYMARHFNEPKDFEHYLFMSQLLQAEGMKVAMEAHRIKKPYNMGSLVWQLNDCWPVASWSSIDYFGRWKALHYYIKRAFEDIIIAFDDDTHHVKIHGISDQYEELNAILVIELINLNGKLQTTEEEKIRLKANSSGEIWKKSKKELMKKHQKEEVYLRAKIVMDQKVIAENTYFFVPHKDLELEIPDIKYGFVEKDDRLFVELNSNKTALAVCFGYGDLKLLFSDNYFTLHAKESKLVEIFSDAEAFEIKNKLIVTSLADSYMP
jgi:beta-mannosidase